MLLASMNADRLDEHLFEVANQFNRGTALLVEPNEKADVATLNLRAGERRRRRRPMLARTYFASGIALLDERDWRSRHELTFSLSLEHAECQLLSGNLEKAEQLIVELLKRAASNVEFADTSSLKINLHVLKREHAQAIDSALACLRLFVSMCRHTRPSSRSRPNTRRCGKPSMDARSRV